MGAWVGGLVWGPRPGRFLWPTAIKARGRASTVPWLCLVGWHGDEEQYLEVGLLDTFILDIMVTLYDKGTLVKHSLTLVTAVLGIVI